MLKEKLQEIKDTNTNLYQHLNNVLTKILLDNPKNAFELFEDYSFQVKQSGFTFEKYNEFDNAERTKVTMDQGIQQKTLKLINKINLGTDEEPQESTQTGYLPNLTEEAYLYEWAGVGIDENYKIFKALTLLSVTKQASKLRFWGKIMGREKDYYIAEGIAASTVEDGELPPEVEPRGSGINTKSYWACTDLLNDKDWIELPLVTPQQINVARQIKYIFTGNLEADVITNPYFFGKEKHLLKAQIVRITQSTVIIPKGQYILREGEPREIDPAPEYKLPGFHDLKTLNDWMHFNQNILNCGRLVHLIPSELPEGVEPEAYQKQIEAADPFENRLKPIQNDKLPNNKPAWKIRIVGDTTDYNPLAKDTNNKVNNGVIIIKSLVWPGLVTVYSNKVLSQLYYGYGFKATTKHFYPKQPQQVQTEQPDLPEQPEPNFPAEVPKQESE
ncbi:unnamed protein product [Paramecium sonneborni]|uniref:Uncharacterized protein n=1 Tax=Paramecium sonneborni TaxID=65129 RepID=A0A8S1QM02_9CILI|nr:unnamed protein product [Paramecium sonneborni]